MLDIISAGALKRYLLLIKSFVKRFPNCWAVIYQADARMRSEKAPRIKDDLEEKHAIAIKNGWYSSFDPAKPWDAVWLHMAESESNWWHTQV